jgi:hypothetical protein
MLWLVVSSAVQHDYYLYVDQWRLVLDGADPWSTDNSYGPLHNLLAYLLPFGPTVPRWAIGGSFLIANLALVVELVRKGGVDVLYGTYLIAIPANFLVAIVGFIYGLNDALCAALVVAAILTRQRRMFMLTGLLLGLAVLLKYYPAILVALFALDDRRIRWRLLITAGAITLAGLALATYVWGSSWIAAISYGADRPAKLLSILASLQAYPELIGGPANVYALLQINSYVVLAVAALAVYVAWRLQMHWLEASVLGLLAVFAAYKVGNQQFYLTWVCLVAALPLADSDTSRRLQWIAIPMLLLLSAFQWGYTFGTDRYTEVLGFVRDGVGFVAGPLAVLMIAAYFYLRAAAADVAHADSIASDR